jgi:hypothetical protein
MSAASDTNRILAHGKHLNAGSARSSERNDQRVGRRCLMYELYISTNRQVKRALSKSSQSLKPHKSDNHDLLAMFAKALAFFALASLAIAAVSH